MKKLLFILAGVLVGPVIAYAVQISVPSSPSAGYVLVATSTGAYVSTTTDPLHVGSLYATSSSATSIFNGNVTINGTCIGCGTGSTGLATTSPISAGNLLVYSATGAGSAFGVATSTLSATSPLTGSFTQIGSGGSLGCQTASGSQAGCLSNTDWTTFNSKQATISATWPITLTGAAVGFNGLSTSSPIAAGAALLYATGVNTIASVATSTLTAGTGLTGSFTQIGSGGSLAVNLSGASCTNQVVTAISSSGAGTCSTVANAMLANSTISGIALGSTLNSHSVSGSITGTSYNGSAAVSNWALNMGNSNWWTARQNFTNASTSQLTATSSVYLATSGGNVGIGTTTPNAPLTVYGNSTGGAADIERSLNDSSVILRLGTQNIASQSFDFSRSNSTGALSIQGNQTGFNNIVLAPTSGNVGIGTTSPATTLSVAGNGYLTGGLGVGVENTTAGTLQTSGLITGGTTLALNGTTGTSTIASGQGFTIGGSQFVVQQGSGNVGIGTTSPDAPLDLNAGTSNALHIETTNSGPYAIIMNNLTYGSGASNGFNFYQTNAGVGNIVNNNTNAIQIGTTGALDFPNIPNSAETYYLCASIGGHTVGFSGPTCGSSDRRLKTNITSLSPTDALAQIEALNPVSFNWKDITQTKTQQLGFIAQAVQQVFPQLVQDNGTSTIKLADGSTQTITDTLSVDYTGLIAPAIAAIQQMNGVYKATGATSSEPTVESYYQGTAAPAIIIDASGQVGIGTTTPVGKLHISAGSSATTTASFGRIGDTTSHACFNTKNTTGADISFYFVGTTMVVENNLCR